MQIAFLSTRSTKPSYRFRVEQMLPYFAQRGHSCTTVFLASTVWGRLPQYRRLARYDVVVLQKRMLSAAELLLLRRSCAKLAYDVDDAVMYDGDGGDNRSRRRRFAAIAQSADLILCGNRFLADEAGQYADHVEIAPTCINTRTFHPRLRRPGSDPLTIGWTGSRSSNPYLNAVFACAARLQTPVRFKIISDTAAGLQFELLGGVPYSFVPWSPKIEISEAAGFDIGVMPLPDDRWTQGKCGFKALQYLALGIPAICSPVGVNCDIIQDGINGYLAYAPDEWFYALARLLKDDRLRASMGKAGRKRVEEAYSLDQHGPRLVQILERLAGSVRRSA